MEQEADRVTHKARKIGTAMRKVLPDLPFVQGVSLLTSSPAKLNALSITSVRGINLHALADWKNAIGFDAHTVLTPQQIAVLSRKLEPKSAIALDGSLRRLADYINLELQTPREGTFHRVYKGVHPTRQDRVALHLYDLSSETPGSEALARREFHALHLLRKYAWDPRILDSYQSAPGYAGEMNFFTMVDPAAPSIGKRSSDVAWNTVGPFGLFTKSRAGSWRTA